MTTSPWRVVAACCIVAAGFCCLAGIYSVMLTNKDAAERDFIEYWAAGQQLVGGTNPYDPVATYRLERAVGLTDDQPRVTLSPPVVFVLALPLGFVSPKAGLTLWLLALVAGLAASVWILWILHGRRNDRLHMFSYLFAPAIACYMAGQIAIFLLLSVVLFLYLHQSRPWLAGAALVPCVLKPHLFVVFSIVLLLWVVSRRAYGILGGFSVVLLASCALPVYFDRHVWSQYLQMVSTARVLPAFVPTLSVAFRFLVDRNAVWLQFLPDIAGCCWGVWYFWTRRTQWNWMDQGLLVLLVSVACAPYAWFSDETILLPAVLSGVYRVADAGRSLLPIAVIAGVALVEVFRVSGLATPYFLWTVPAWLAWYVYASRCGGRAPAFAAVD